MAYDAHTIIALNNNAPIKNSLTISPHLSEFIQPIFTKSKSAHRPFVYSNTKTKSSIREIEMPDKFFTQLNRYIEECSPLDEHIFGETTDTKIINKKLQALLESIGSSKIISPHGLRHTHASVLINHGVDIQYVSERLGHSNVSITQTVYTHLLDTKRGLEADKTLDILR
ncbi:site-specific integrase [Weissella kandleri]|uniref:site-specific integrase n=1 Tax=Weissella kandleri TaxID=1616 RepID=UPI00387ED078